MAGVLPKYFSSEWSFAQFRVPEETKTIVAFGPQKDTIVIVCANGRFVFSDHNDYVATYFLQLYWIIHSTIIVPTWFLLIIILCFYM